MEKKLRITLELISRGFQSGTRGATNLFKNFTNSMVNGALTASRSLVSLAQTVFFVREALSTLFNIARRLWDLFVGGAQSLAKIQAQFIALTGSVEAANEVLEFAKERALALGKPVEDVAGGLALMASGAKDASGAFDMNKLEELNVTLEQLAALRPDLPIERIARAFNAFLASGDISQLEMIMDMPLKSAEAMKGIAQDLGDATDSITQGVVTLEGAASEAAGDADARLQALKDTIKEVAPGVEQAVEAMSDVSGLERLKAAANDMANAFGGPVFEAINEVATAFADIYEADPEAFRAIAKTLGESVGELIKQLTEFDAEKLAEGLAKLNEQIAAGDWGGFLDTLGGIGDVFERIADAIVKINEIYQDPQTPIAEGLARESDVIAGGLEQQSATIAEALSQNPIAEAIQRVIIEIDLKNDMLEANMSQVANKALTIFGDTVSEELQGSR